jgi:hypothetical protein
MNIMLGLVMAVGAIGALFWTGYQFVSVLYLPQGALFLSLGLHNWVRVAGRIRHNAVRALELNRLAAHSGA